MYDSNDNRYGNSDNQTSPPSARRNISPMALSSAVCAVLSIFFMFFGMYFALILGSVAILFSFLSRGSKPKAERAAIFGRVVGCIAVTVCMILIVVSLVLAVREYGSLENYYNTYLTTIEETYGIDLGLDDSL